MKTVKFYEMENNKFYYTKDFANCIKRPFYWLTNRNFILRNQFGKETPSYDNPEATPLTKEIMTAEFIEWEEPKKLFEPTLKDWKTLEDVVMSEKDTWEKLLKDKPASSFAIGAVMALRQILKEMEFIEKKDDDFEKVYE